MWIEADTAYLIAAVLVGQVLINVLSSYFTVRGVLLAAAAQLKTSSTVSAGAQSGRPRPQPAADDERPSVRLVGGRDVTPEAHVASFVRWVHDHDAAGETGSLFFRRVWMLYQEFCEVQNSTVKLSRRKLPEILKQHCRRSTVTIFESGKKRRLTVYKFPPLVQAATSPSAQERAERAA